MGEELVYSRLVRSPPEGAKRGKEKKNKRKNRKEGKKKRKNRKERKNKRKNGKKGRNQTVSRKNPRAVSDSCFDQAVTIMKMWKDVISNFQRQKKRIEKQIGTGINKSGKKGAFSGVYQKLLSAGGGDKTNLTCTATEGTSQLTNLTSSLFACQTDISSACDPASWPQPNMTKVVRCEGLATKFITGAQAESSTLLD